MYLCDVCVYIYRNVNLCVSVCMYVHLYIVYVYVCVSLCICVFLCVSCTCIARVSCMVTRVFCCCCVFQWLSYSVSNRICFVQDRWTCQVGKTPHTHTHTHNAHTQCTHTMHTHNAHNNTQCTQCTHIQTNTFVQSYWHHFWSCW